MSVIQEIVAERHRHHAFERWFEYEDQCDGGEIAAAAACYAIFGVRHLSAKKATEDFWPWDRESWKPKDRRRDLIRAAALIVAEIERLDRAAAKETAA